MRRKLTAVIALTSTACTTWQIQPEPAPIAAEKNASNSPVRLDLTSGQRIDIYDPHVVRDSIIGFARRPQSGEDVSQSGNRLAVATADVQNVSVRKLARGRTILAVTGIVLATAVIAGASSGGGQTGNSSCASSPTPSKVLLPGDLTH